MPEPYTDPIAWLVTAACAGAIFYYLLIVLPRK